MEQKYALIKQKWEALKRLKAVDKIDSSTYKRKMAPIYLKLWPCEYIKECMHKTAHEQNSCKERKRVWAAAVTAAKDGVAQRIPDVSAARVREAYTHVRMIIRMNTPSEPCFLMAAKIDHKTQFNRIRGISFGFPGGSCDVQQRNLRYQCAIELLQELCGVADPQHTHPGIFDKVLACIPNHGISIPNATNGEWFASPTMFFEIDFAKLRPALGYHVQYTWCQRDPILKHPLLGAECIIFLQWIPASLLTSFNKDTHEMVLPKEGKELRGMRVPTSDIATLQAFGIWSGK